MLFLTHLWMGYLVYIVIISLLTGQSFSIIELIAILFGSIFPDIDHKKSKIAQRIPIIPALLQFIFGHRGIIHSSIGIITIGIIYFIIEKVFFFKATILIWFALGYLIHLIGDSLTPQGIEFIPKFIRIHGYIKTGTFAEKMFFFMILISSIIITIKYFF